MTAADIAAKARRVLAGLPDPQGPPGRSPWMPDPDTVEANKAAMDAARAERARRAKETKR